MPFYASIKQATAYYYYYLQPNYSHLPPELMKLANRQADADKARKLFISLTSKHNDE